MAILDRTVSKISRDEHVYVLVYFAALSETTESLRSIKRKLKEIKLMLTKLTLSVRQQGTLGCVWAYVNITLVSSGTVWKAFLR